MMLTHNKSYRKFSICVDYNNSISYLVGLPSISRFFGFIGVIKRENQSKAELTNNFLLPKTNALLFSICSKRNVFVIEEIIHQENS